MYSERDSSSPIIKKRYKNAIDENSEAYQTAMNKLYDAAWKFDRGKNGNLLKTLDNKEIEKTNFRTILRGGMNCKLSEDDLEALMPLWENHGYVNGCEFILLFYRLRYDFRSKLLTQQLQKNKKGLEQIEYAKKKKLEVLEEKLRLNLVDDYTKADLDSAMEKIINAAVKYDRMMPGAVQLDAFDCEVMPPHVLKEQLKMTFNIQLNIAELSAFIRHFNKDKEMENEDDINCSAFLVTFFRLGFKEKSRRLHAKWDEKKRIQEAEAIRIEEEKKEQERKNNLKTNLDFTPEDKDSAILKLRAAARLYDKSSSGCMSMKAFEVQEMPPHVFKEQLFQVFNLKVTPAEMGALMYVFDANGDGVITCEEFTKIFLNMGFVEREKELRDSIARQKRAEEKRLKNEEKKRQELANKNSLKVSYEYTEEEFQSAIQKLVEAAWRYDKNMAGAPCLDAFDTKEMEAHVLKEQLKRAFWMKVTPPELGALMHFFDPTGSGKINCEQFLKKFFKTGFDERQRRGSMWRKFQREQNIQRKKEEEEKIRALDNKQALAVKARLNDFTEADFQSAFAKLTTGAIKYEKNGAGSIGLEGFDVVSIPPHVFREQLKLVFNVQLTMPELAALMSYFDKENTGEINCKNFLIQFGRTGMEERERIRQGWRNEDKSKREQMQREMQAKEEAKARKAWSEVDFEFLESDFDSALNKVLWICHDLDPRQLGPAGLSAFECDSLNPAEFREMAKRTFNLQMTARELGAIITYYDTHMKKVLDCRTFMNSLVQMRVKCEEFKGKKNETSLMREYCLELKEIYKERVSRSHSTEAKPWRQKNQEVQNKKKVGVVKGLGGTIAAAGGETGPSTGLEKYKLRMAIGRKTYRLDLSCKSSWTDKDIAVPPPSVRGEKEENIDEYDGILFYNEPLRPGTEPPPSRTRLGSSSNSQEGAEGDSIDHSIHSGAVSELDHHGAESLTGDGKNSRDASPNNRSRPRTGHDSSSVNSAHSLPGGGELLMEGMSLVEVESKRFASRPQMEFLFTKVPKEILKISELNELWLDNHNISQLPTGIASLKQLKVLSLSNNNIETLPPELCLVDNLRKLYVRGNSLTMLPNLFGRLRKLIEFDGADNNFSAFPEVLTSLHTLISLDLSFNALNALPDSMDQMKCLYFFNLTGNAFTKAPTVLGNLPWATVKGAPLPAMDRVCTQFLITPGEEEELTNLIKSRAKTRAAQNAILATKLRRRRTPATAGAAAGSAGTAASKL